MTLKTVNYRVEPEGGFTENEKDSNINTPTDNHRTSLDIMSCENIPFPAAVQLCQKLKRSCQ